MIPLSEVLRILGELREEALQGVEQPAEGYRSSFGYGRVSGMLQMNTRMNEAVMAVANALAEQAKEAPPRFEGDQE